MRRLIALTVVAVAAALAYSVLSNVKQTIILTAAKAVSVHGQPGQLRVVLSIDNKGAPDRLIGAQSDAGKTATIINPEGEMAIVIPGADSAVLDADGVHIILQDLDPEYGVGALFPITLEFEGAGKVTTRALHAPMDAMDHGAMMMDEVRGLTGPAPVLAFSPDIMPAADGFEADLSVKNMTLLQTPDGTAHVPGEGHAHLYLNGLKLGRLFKPVASVGSLMPGDYVLRVTLNSNDHRPYSTQDGPVGDTIRFQVEAR
ncbi:MAG: copper chaperone PCu(A)C [Sulfitobacter sp.]